MVIEAPGGEHCEVWHCPLARPGWAGVGSMPAGTQFTRPRTLVWASATRTTGGLFKDAGRSPYWLTAGGLTGVQFGKDLRQTPGLSVSGETPALAPW